MARELVDRGLDLHGELTRLLHERGAPVWVQTELSVAQIKALFTVADFGPISIGGVAARLRIGLPAASSLVDRLFEHGLLLRREDRIDRRRTLAEATAEGRALSERLRQGSREALTAWMEQMDGGDLRALLRGLSALVAIGGSPTRLTSVEPDRVGAPG